MIVTNNLKKFLDSSNIPVVKQHVGFLDIIRKTTNETINSNIYAHFLSCDEDEIKYAFLNTLLSIIKEKTKLKTQLSDTEVFTEYTTNSGRIDIVIRDLINENHIIIENKIYHHLDNDLLEYWSFFKDIPDDKKRGVLLTLNEHQIDEKFQGKYINITHWEWISKVKELIDISKIQKANYLVYLTDFFETTESLIDTHNMNESAKFYFENAMQINAATETKHEGHRFLDDQYNLIASKLGMVTFGNELDWKNFWDEKNRLDTYFTVVVENITAGRSLTYSIIIELMREDAKKVNELNAKFKNHNQFLDKRQGNITDKYTHYLVKDYDTTIDEFEKFAENVVANIRKDFGQIFTKIVKHIHPTKNISDWVNNVVESE